MKKTRMQLWLGLRILFMATFILITFNGCKKDLSSEEKTAETKIQKAKSWYLEKQKHLKSTISSSKSEEKLIFNPDWQNATIETIDGNDVITMPIVTNVKKITGLESEYNLVILVKDKGYTSKTVSVNVFNKNKKLSPSQLYYTAFTEKNIAPSNDLFAEIKVLNSNFGRDKHNLYTDEGVKSMDILEPSLKNNKNNSKDKTSVIIDLCIEWYLITRYYDANNTLIGYEEVYLGTTCERKDTEAIDYIEPEGGSNGGGPVRADSTDVVIWGAAIDELDYVTPLENSETELEGGSLQKRRKVQVGWWFYRAQQVGVKFRSIENAEVFKNDGSYWMFASYLHLAAVSVGNTTGTSVPNVLGTETIFSGLTVRGTKLTFQEIRTYRSKKGQDKTDYGPVLWASRSWTAEDLALHY